MDKEIVVMHNSTLGELMNAKGTVETTSYADLKNYTYKNFDDSYRIPTLKEFIEYFKTIDCMLVIELKGYDQGLAEAVAKMIREYQFEDQCVVICFSKQALHYLYSAFPEVSCGGLSSTVTGCMKRFTTKNTAYYKNGELLFKRNVVRRFRGYRKL